VGIDRLPCLATTVSPPQPREPGGARVQKVAIARKAGRRVSIPQLWLGATLLRVKSLQAECKYFEKAAKSRRDMQALQRFGAIERARFFSRLF